MITQSGLSDFSLALPSPDAPGVNYRYNVAVDEVAADRWSALIEQFADANIYQTWAYGAVRWGVQSLSHLVMTRGHELCGLAQLRIMRVPGLNAGIAYLRWGPLCHPKGSAPESELIMMLASALRQEYVVKRGLFLEVLPNAFAGTPRAERFESAFTQFSRRPGLSRENYQTLLLDLSLPLDELRRRLNKKWRNQLTAAERDNDLTIITGTSSSFYETFRQIYSQMRQRKQFTSGVSIDQFGNIEERLPERHKMHILICEHRRVPTAGLVFSAIGDTAIYLLGATNELGMQLKSSYLLQWTAIQHLKKAGVRYYDLGGIDPQLNYGVYHFKRGLAAAEMRLISPFTDCENRLSRLLIKTTHFVRR